MFAADDYNYGNASRDLGIILSQVTGDCVYTFTSYDSVPQLTAHYTAPPLAQCTDTVTVTGSTAPIAFRQWPRKVVVSDGWNRGSGIRGIQKDLQRSAPARGRGAEALPSSEK